MQRTREQRKIALGGENASKIGRTNQIFPDNEQEN